MYNHVVGSPAQRFFLLLFSFLCPNFVIWKKKIWKFSQSFNKSSQIYTRKTKKFHFPFFLSRTTKFVRKKKPRHLSQHVRLGGVVGGCAFLSLLVMWVINYYAKVKNLGRYQMFRKMRILLVLVRYIYQDKFDPGIGYKTDSWLVWGRYKSGLYNGIKLIHGWYEHWYLGAVMYQGSVALKKLV